MSSLFKEIFSSTFFTIVKSAILFISTAIAARYLSSEYLGFILVWRRQSAAFAGMLTLGQTQVILRYGIDNQKGIYWCISIIIMLLVSLIFGFIVYLFSDFFSELILGSDNKILFVLFILYVLATVLNYFAYSSWLSIRKYSYAHISEISALGVVFIISIILFRNNLIKICLFNVLGAILFSCISIGLFSQHIMEKVRGLSWIDFSMVKIKESLQFGFPRGFSAFLESALFVIGPWCLIDSPSEAGSLTLALTVIKLLQIIVMPISQVFSLRFLDGGASNKGKNAMLKIFFVTQVISWGFVILYHFIGKEFLFLWLDGAADGVVFFMKYLIYFSPAFIGYYFFRSIIDIHYQRPYTLYTLLLALLIFYSICTHGHGILIEKVISALQGSFLVLYAYSTVAVLNLSYKDSV